MPIAAGTRLGPYEIVAPIGAGGMGEVYRARDPRLGRDVAIKILPDSFALDTERLRRFEQEARSAGQLNHPNITAVHDVGAGTDGGPPYLVTELLEGESLRDVLSAGKLSSRRAIECAVQLARGLAAAHEKGIVHRDLKPDNVFVTLDGRVKILDFGLAKLTQLEGSGSGSATSFPTQTAATEPGVVLGTLGYMAPEQVRGKPADARSDLFSFGAILYEMLSGKRAFHGDSAADTMSAILKEDPPELSVTGQSFPPGLERIVRHCLEKSPERRFHSAHDLAFDLEALTDVSGTGRVAAAPDREERSRRRWLLPVAGAAAVVAIAAAGWLGYRRGAGARPASPSFRQMTYRQQPIFNARFAPDGKTMVFSSAPVGNSPDIYTVRPDFPGSTPRGLGDVHLLSVSSKGELAVLTNARFIAHSLFSGTLARMPLEGAAPRAIRSDVREADWNPEGTELVIIRDSGGQDTLEYPPGRVLATSGGYLSNPRFSPKGDRIAFFEHPIRWDDRGAIVLVDLAGNKTRLSDDYWGLEGLAWTPDGREVLFSGGSSYNNFMVYAHDLAGGRRVALQSAGGITILDVGRDGRWLVTRDDLVRTMWVSRPGWTAERDLSWLDLPQPVAFSRNGEMLLFSEESGSVGAHYAVCMRQTEGSDVVRLGDGSALDLSPDGKWALGSIPSTPQVLVLYPTGPGEARRLDSGTVVSHVQGAFFPDGRRIVLTGNEEGRAARCWVLELGGGKPRAATPEGSHECFPSPDGGQILARRSDGSGLVVYPAAGGPGRAVPNTGEAEVPLRWGADGTYVLVLIPDRVPSDIVRVDLATGKHTLLRAMGPLDLKAVTGIFPIAIGFDEKTYGYTARQMISQLYLVDGAR